MHFSVPVFDICNVDKSDHGLTSKEVHTASCQGYISALGGSLENVDPSFELFDTDKNGIVTTKEFLAVCTKLINA